MHKSFVYFSAKKLVFLQMRELKYLVFVVLVVYTLRTRAAQETKKYVNAGVFTLTEPIVSTLKQSALECATYCMQKKCLSFTYGGNKPNETKLCEIFTEPLMLDHNGPINRPGAKHMKMVGEVLNRAQCQHQLVSGGTYNIPNSAITESSTTNRCYNTARSRLNTRHQGSGCPVSPYYWAGGWAPSKSRGYWWIQADFGVKLWITGIITQGRNSYYSQWTKTYKVMYGKRTDHITFYRDVAGVDKIFVANKDKNTKVTNTFKNPIQARYVRVKPETYFRNPSLRFDVKGCPIEN